ncbi:MAG TPA: hypothetical protein VF719_12265 [Abditibacteriaceae bacterium]|jgi:hypothetical protein
MPNNPNPNETEQEKYYRLQNERMTPEHSAKSFMGCMGMFLLFVMLIALGMMFLIWLPKWLS